jgi:hypothetical protein
MRNAGNNPNLKIERSEWRQPTNQNRLGRLLVLHFSFDTPVTDEPWVVVTAGASIDVELVSLDGSHSSSAGIIHVP